MALLDCVEIFLNQYHLLLIILNELPFIDLLRFRHQPGQAKRAVDHELARRVFIYLDPFISKISAPRFFAVLKDCDGIITGSVVRQVLLHNKLAIAPSRTLTIFVRNGSSSQMRDFIKGLGYETGVVSTVIEPSEVTLVQTRLNVVEKVEHFDRVDSSGQVCRIHRLFASLS